MLESQMHKIQRQIIAKITSGKSFTFTQLKPEGIENDQFVYHLKKLIKDKLIAKRKDRYYLTREGKKHQEEDLSINIDSTVIDKFNIASLIIVINENHEVLYQRRTRHPNFNDLMIPGKRLKKGELAEDAAARCLNTEVGLKVNTSDLQFVGILRKIRYEKYTNNKILSDFFYHIFVCSEFKGEPIETISGSHTWMNIDEAMKHELNDENGSKRLAKLYKEIYDMKPFTELFYETEKLYLEHY